MLVCVLPFSVGSASCRESCAMYAAACPLPLRVRPPRASVLVDSCDDESTLISVRTRTSSTLLRALGNNIKPWTGNANVYGREYIENGKRGSSKELLRLSWANSFSSCSLLKLGMVRV